MCVCGGGGGRMFTSGQAHRLLTSRALVPPVCLQCGDVTLNRNRVGNCEAAHLSHAAQKIAVNEAGRIELSPQDQLPSNQSLLKPLHQ